MCGTLNCIFCLYLCRKISFISSLAFLLFSHGEEGIREKVWWSRSVRRRVKGAHPVSETVKNADGFKDAFYKQFPRDRIRLQAFHFSLIFERLSSSLISIFVYWLNHRLWRLSDMASFLPLIMKLVYYQTRNPCEANGHFALIDFPLNNSFKLRSNRLNYSLTQ